MKVWSLRGLAGLVLAAVTLGLNAAQTAEADHQVPIPVTISILSVEQQGNAADTDADIYVGSDIGGGGRDDGNSFENHIDDQDFVAEFPYWTITRTVTRDHANPGTIPITLETWDHDDCDTPFCDDTGAFESDDDQTDLQPGDGKTATLSLDLATGRWTGTVNWPQNCITGDTDARAKLCFDISIDGAGDADGDFLLDGWERNGYNADGDSTIDVNLPAMGANPLRRDLFVEIDCLLDNTNATVGLRHTHCPVQAGLAQVVQAFANAPTSNADGSQGIQLHLDVGGLYGHAAGADTRYLRTGAAAGGLQGSIGNYGGGGNQIAEAGNLIVDWDGATGRPGTSFYTLKTGNFNANRALIFRYNLWVHQVNARSATNDCTSGWAEGGADSGGVLRPGNDLIVSLGGTRGTTGNPCWGVDAPATNNSIGTQTEQAGTFMHEFGHTLSLDHGGGDEVNNKPNYLSVMNYTFQSCTVTAFGPNLPGGCDFSRDDLADLAEGMPPGLDECRGIDGGTYGIGPNNWDGDGTFGAGPNLEGTTCSPQNGGNYGRDINGDYNDANGDGDQDPGEATTISTLQGFDDWDAVRFDFRTASSFSDGGVPAFKDEATPEMLAAARLAFAALIEPEITLDKTGPADAAPGDTLTYSLAVQNIGDGPAKDVQLTDTKPDGAVESFQLGNLLVGSAGVSRTVTFGVACTAPDGLVLVNGAAASGTDLLGNVFSAADSVSTTVHAPVLTLSKTATASVAAGEAITYRLTYENTGSGSASGVAIVDRLPAGVYYSAALDTGAGPAPTSASLDGDGRWRLVWNIGALAAGTGPQTIEFTARPTLLFAGGETLTNEARLTFTNGNGCTYAPVDATASTSISVVPPSEDPVGLGYWRSHPGDLPEEMRARIQATDQRFDGADGSAPDGALSSAEIAAMLIPGGNMDKVIKMQLLTTFANLATRRINANTAIESRLAEGLGLLNVADAANYAMETLTLPVISQNRARYSDATTALDQINNNRSPVY